MNDLSQEMIHIPFWGWTIFNLFVAIIIAADLFILHRNKEVISAKQALAGCAMWISLALIFNFGIFYFYGKEVALNFLTGYLIEESLSLDNLFVFILIFEYFHIPRQYQYKVLFWGILGAVAMRTLFIFFGIALVSQFHWILYLFGAFLIYAAIKMVLPKQGPLELENNFVIKQLTKIIPISNTFEGDKFFIRKNSQWRATLLFATLIIVEMTDLIFAMDSIPAVMAITLDPFIVYTSNIFAILGLRSLYFALANLIPLFHYLKYGLATILGFVGVKMLLQPWLVISIGISLTFIALSILLAIVASLAFPKKMPRQ